MKNFFIYIVFLPTILFGQTSDLKCLKFIENKKLKRESQLLKEEWNDCNFLSLEDYRETVFFIIQESWKANRRPTTVSLLTNGAFPLENRRVGQYDGDGIDNIYLLEADFNLNYPLILGRTEYGSASAKLTRFEFEYGINFRMLYDNSSPIIPPNQRVGLSFIRNFWNNRSKYIWNAYRDISSNPVYNINSNNRKSLRFVNFLAEIMHYSNGQSGDIQFIDEGTGDARNNYKNGDFSTNYVFGQLTYGVFNQQIKSLNQYSLGLRVDWGKDEWTFAYFEEQERAYGRVRLNTTYDYRSPFNNSQIELHIRAQLGYIFGDLSKYNPNVVDYNNNEKKYRANGQLLMEVIPRNHRAIGYFVSAYSGRDYMNIRYDDIVFVFRMGLSLSLDRYKINRI